MQNYTVKWTDDALDNFDNMALGFTNYRKIIYKRWCIIYSVENKNVYLLLILDSRQDIQEQLMYRILNH